MNQITDISSFALQAGEAGFDPIEERLRMNVRVAIEAVFEEELAGFLGRLRYGRGDGAAKGVSPRSPRPAIDRHFRDGNGAGAAGPDRG